MLQQEIIPTKLRQLKSESNILIWHFEIGKSNAPNNGMLIVPNALSCNTH